MKWVHFKFNLGVNKIAAMAIVGITCPSSAELCSGLLLFCSYTTGSWSLGLLCLGDLPESGAQHGNVHRGRTRRKEETAAVHQRAGYKLGGDGSQKAQKRDLWESSLGGTAQGMQRQAG